MKSHLQSYPCPLQINSFDKPEGQVINEKIKAVRDIFEKYPVIAALKATKIKEHINWSSLRPPLVALSDQQRLNLTKDLKDINKLNDELSFYKNQN